MGDLALWESQRCSLAQYLLPIEYIVHQGAIWYLKIPEVVSIPFLFVYCFTFFEIGSGFKNALRTPTNPPVQKSEMRPGAGSCVFVHQPSANWGKESTHT